MSIIIRQGKPEDISQTKNHLIELWVEHSKHEPDLLDEEKMRNTDAESHYNKCLENPDKNFVFVAEDSGKIVGFLASYIDEIPAFFEHPTILYLDEIFVLPDYRRQGVAQSLILQAENIAKEKGIKRIQARVYTFNTGMHKFLESMGYRAPYATWDKTLE
ncbi:TPA: GNAT family N-acetyltransferase [Candidatus Berkelbacteria bacterium]|uniref:Acetyltransferase n=1 Tax=Berkelbacteria bacterium GW2011_GWE1_39_12 TaxID=1618337 RepID=A0A0G4B4N9_9BACT|nr:MAG: acetyltransferase [Berkelbacteria bacterium GW2011_GWE1_39_12]HBO60958.1 GNAT family N-acetyltransferase [Candidatus Berkelbacteria bacterium]